jgi:hypothetical protein
MKHSQSIGEMVKSFVQSAGGLMTVTKSEDFEHQRFMYGKIFAKPSKRLSVLLAVEREILVLTTNFDDQQVRTVKAAKSVIDYEQGRVETTLAIVVHNDPAGNVKLKRWGRDIGLTILPIYFGTQLPREDEFERMLCRELFSHDPFDVTGPVSDDSQFYGRRTEAQDLARQLQRGQVRACLGIRKIGKTSILNRVVNTLRANHECYSVMIDCSKDHVAEMHANQLLDAIASAVHTASQTDERYFVIQQSTTTQSISVCADKLLTTISSCGLPIILLFDEVDYVTPSSPTAPHWQKEFNPFWRNFRAVYQECSRNNKKLSLLISGVSTKWFSAETIAGVENAALALIPEEYLSPLPRGASIAMIRDIARTCGLQFNDENAGPIASACSDFPFWIRKACSYIHRNIDVQSRPLRPDPERVQSLLNAFIETEGSALSQVALAHLFRVYPELENAAISCLKGQFSQVSKSLQTQLERYGIITNKAGKRRISGAMLEQGLRNLVEPKQTGERENGVALKAEVKPQSLSFANSEEWAEELAVINRRRNLLEKKIRDIALNFIRFDSLQQKQKGTVSERLLKVIDENRRNKMSDVTAEHIIEKFNWTDLTAVFEREWSLFEKIFSDKKSFSENSKVINERFDAHAKKADHADLALYRRSLNWLEDKVSGL